MRAIAVVVHRKNFVHVGNEEVGKTWRFLENLVLAQTSVNADSINYSKRAKKESRSHV
jgi:hypothetical protein